MSRTLVCRCEDVTVEDVKHAIDRGYSVMASVKPYTGLATGICQGKSCEGAVARLLCQSEAQKPASVKAFTPRTPLYPTELSVLATVPWDEAAPPVGGTPPDLRVSEPALRPSEPLPGKARVVI